MRHHRTANQLAGLNAHSITPSLAAGVKDRLMGPATLHSTRRQNAPAASRVTRTGWCWDCDPWPWNAVQTSKEYTVGAKVYMRDERGVEVRGIAYSRLIQKVSKAVENPGRGPSLVLEGGGGRLNLRMRSWPEAKRNPG